MFRGHEQCINKNCDFEIAIETTGILNDLASMLKLDSIEEKAIEGNAAGNDTLMTCRHYFRLK
jgi:hypothetical protein